MTRFEPLMTDDDQRPPMYVRIWQTQIALISNYTRWIGTLYWVISLDNSELIRMNLNGLDRA